MRRHFALLAFGLAAAVPLSASAGTHVGVSVGVPGLAINFGNPGWGIAIAAPVYAPPAPAYYSPAPVYRPAPVYYAPAPVYRPAPVVYYRQPVYYAPPVRYVAPRAVVVVPRHGHHAGHRPEHRGHGYGHGYGYSYGNDRQGDSRHWR
jgi:hypothetical protein